MHLDPKTWWYVTRASGFVSWSLLAVAVLWGLFITNKTLNRSTAPAWVLDLHRHLGGLAVVFVAVHVGALPLDGYTHWVWSDLFVPMSSTWHPGAIACGIVAMYLLIAVEVTSLLGRRFPKKWWRRVHMLSFPLYILASIHLFAAGTDSGNPVAQWIVVTVSTLIAFLTLVRALAAMKPRETRANPRTAAARAQSPRSASDPSAMSAPPASPPSTRAVGDLLPEVATAPRRPTRVPTADSTPSGLATRRLVAPTVDERVARLHEHTATAVARARAHRQSTRVAVTAE